MDSPVRVSSQRVYADARDLVTAVAYVVVYLVLDWLSNIQPVLNLDITSWNPQPGLTLTFFLIKGPRWWPATAIAAFLAEILMHDGASAWPEALAASVWIGAVYGALAAVLLRWNMPRHIEATIAAARLAIASTIATAVVALGYVAVFVVAGALPSDAALSSIARYWVGDLNSILTLTPILLAVDQWRGGWRTVWRQATTVMGQFGAIVLTMWVVFGLAAPEAVRFFYLLFVPVIWITLRWGVLGATLSTLTIQLGLIVVVEADASAPPLFDLQFLLLTLSMTGLLLGAVVNERAEVLKRVAMREAEQRALRHAQELLQEREAALARAMRFAMAGELASALAHELNQPIAAVVSYLQAAEILATPASGDVRLQETLGKATHEAIRASQVIRRLRDFYRAGSIKREHLQISALCETLANTFQERLRSGGVELVTNVPKTLPAIQTGITQLEIVLHNLLSNAIDAVMSQPAGARKVELTAACLTTDVVVRLQDSGPGVSAELLPQLFEPFVTSKSDGLGLGLAISRSLLRAQGGDLMYATGVRRGGACFLISLPLSSPEPK